jgi:hypothetical protein
VHKPVRTTYATILEGQITLDRAIKHIANHAGVASHGVVVVPGQPRFGVQAELEAVMFLEGKWDELESYRVHKVNVSRIKKKQTRRKCKGCGATGRQWHTFDCPEAQQ